MPFVDKAFPPNETSLGPCDILTSNPDINIKWVPLKQALDCAWDERPELFKDGIQPEDINQGGLGDCWLMSGLACLAHWRPNLIESSFVWPLDENEQPMISPSGKYVIQICDVNSTTDPGKWVEVVIDDMIPCFETAPGSWQPLFAQPEGNEAWVLLLEKAFAKYFGSYAAMEGGTSSWVFKALGGDEVDDYITYVCEEVNKETYIWEARKTYSELRKRAKYFKCSVKRRWQYATHPNGRDLCTDDLMRKLMKWRADADADFILGAGSKGRGDDTEHICGVWCSHAYSVLDIIACPGFYMIKLANPHGTGGREWEGKWGNDDTKRWKEHPEVKEACGWSGGCNQGIFFMEGNDFTKVFGTIFVARAPKKQGWGDRKPGLEGEDWVKNKESGDDVDVSADQDKEASDKDCDWDAEVASVFKAFDADESGTISRRELKPAIRHLTNRMPSIQALNQLMQLAGADPAGALDFQQFKVIAKCAAAVQRFLELDADGDGTLDLEEISQLVLEMESGGSLRSQFKLLVKECLWGSSTNKLQQLLASYDEDGDAKLSLEEFVDLWRNEFGNKE